MSWDVFTKLVLAPGSVLVVMLVSGQELAMKLANKALQTPVRVGTFRVTVAVVITIFCALLGALSFASLRRAEERVQATERSGSYSLVWEELRRDEYHAGRNFYITLLGTTIWAVAWRLNSLYSRKLLVSYQVAERRSRPLFQRLFFFVLGILCLLLADLPICRLNYNFQLYTFVTPKKEQLLRELGPCQSAMLSSSTEGPCADFCARARQLSEDRLATIEWARNWHTLGSIAARVFDDARGVDQGANRIQELFRKKTCAQVLKGVDKSNMMVNAMCVLFAIISLLGFFASISSAISGAADPAGTTGAPSGNIPGVAASHPPPPVRPHGD